MLRFWCHICCSGGTPPRLVQLVLSVTGGLDPRWGKNVGTIGRTGYPFVWNQKMCNFTGFVYNFAERSFHMKTLKTISNDEFKQ